MNARRLALVGLLVCVAGLLVAAPSASAAAVSQVTATNTPPSHATGARTHYVVSFITSQTGGLSGSNARMNVTFPSGTGLDGVSGSVFNVTKNQDAGNCFAHQGQTIQCFLFGGAVVAGGDKLEIRFRSVINPSTLGQYSVSVSTTADTDPVSSSPSYSVVNDQQLSNLTVENNSPSEAASARTQYVVDFTTSGTGGLSSAANSEVTVTFPSGTGLNGVSGSVFAGPAGEAIGNCFAPQGQAIRCFLFGGDSVAPSSAVRIIFSGLTNPPTASSSYALTVSTTSDHRAVTSPFYDVVAAHPLTGLSVANEFPTAAAGGKTQYLVDFTTSSTGGLSSGANSRITVTFPNGTGLSGSSGSVFDGPAGQAIGNCFAPQGQTIQCFFFGGEAVAASDDVRVVFSGLTNPPTAGSRTLSVSTTSDTQPVTSPSYNVVGANPVTGVSLAPDTEAAGATTRWIVNFTTSPTGRLSSGANSRTRVTFPTGTGLSGVSGSLFDVTANQGVGNCFAPQGQTIECFLFGGEVIDAGSQVRITFNNVTNPSSAGPYAIDASTTSDPQPVSSNQGGSPEPPPPPPPPPPQTPEEPDTLEELPNPGFASTVNVQELSGQVLIGIPSNAASTRSGRAQASQKGITFVPLSEVRQIPVGSFLDTRRGSLRLQSARDRRGTRQNGDFSQGLFQVLQSRRSKGLTDVVLKGASFASCRRGGRGKRAQAAASIRRRLRANARGRFRTRGRHSAATVRGTVWSVQDRCDGTLTKVTRGQVAVRDFRRKRTVLVRAGKSYLAKARR